VKKKENLTALIFLTPALIGFSIFLIFPVIFSLLLSFFEWDLVSGWGGLNFVGIKHFIDMWSIPEFINSLRNNFIYSGVTVPMTMILGFIFAVILNSKVYLKGILRLIYFLPYVANIVAISAVWQALYHPTRGPINQFLYSLGMNNPPRWLADPNYALTAIMIMTIWLGTGYCMIIYMAALNGIPERLYEAAKIDGANRIQSLIKITIPMVSHATFFLLVTRLIWSFLVFGPINIMTQGGPAQSTTVLVFHIYRRAFRFRQLGYGSAVTWIMFLIILSITIFQWRKRESLVNYKQ